MTALNICTDSTEIATATGYGEIDLNKDISNNGPIEHNTYVSYHVMEGSVIHICDTERKAWNRVKKIQVAGHPVEVEMWVIQDGEVIDRDLTFSKGYDKPNPDFIDDLAFKDGYKCQIIKLPEAEWSKYHELSSSSWWRGFLAASSDYALNEFGWIGAYKIEQAQWLF